MYKLYLFFLIVFSNSFLYAQKVEYGIPAGVENAVTQEEYKKIVDLAVPIVKQRYKIDFVKDGTIQLVTGQDMQAFNLDNLILKCADEKDHDVWKDIIGDHFKQMFASIDAQKSIDPENFETVRKFLSIRIYPKETVMQRGGVEKLIVKTDLEGTYTMLMLDLPGAFTNVEKTMFDLWKKDTAEVFAIAQSNINKEQVEKVTKEFDIDGTNIEINFIGNENYAASYALDLQNNSPEFVGEWGTVIAIPNKGLVNLCKVSKNKPLDFVKFVQRTKPMTDRSFAEHEQPISDQYFWYYKGKFTRMNVFVDDKGLVNVVSPPGLTILLTSLK